MSRVSHVALAAVSWLVVAGLFVLDAALSVYGVGAQLAFAPFLFAAAIGALLISFNGGDA